MLEALIDYAKWYTERFGVIRPEWYVFAFGRPWPKDPTRAMVTLKTSWTNVRTKANVKGRWHDNSHTLITDLAESGAGDETIRDIAGHVSKQMLKHYSDIRTDAKRRALEAILKTPKESPAVDVQSAPIPGASEDASPKIHVKESPQVDSKSADGNPGGLFASQANHRNH